MTNTCSSLKLLFVLCLLLLLSGCTVLSTTEKTTYPVNKTQRAVASYYHHSLANLPTASGELYNPRLMTAAHRSLPFGTIVKLTNKENGRSVYVRINDRGPFISGREFDLSFAAAEKLGIIKQGIRALDYIILPMNVGMFGR